MGRAGDKNRSVTNDASAQVRSPLRTLLEWSVLGVVVGVLVGAGSAIFLWLLERATHLRESHERLVYALPIAGLMIGAIYEKWGAQIKGGNNLVLDTIHDDSPQIPLRMAPMVVIGTVLTHVFGGSAGREGTAVQMGASVADMVAHRARVKRDMRHQLLAAGMAGGFGAIFGTPWAGAIFGLEVVAIGRPKFDALVPALIAAFTGDMVCRALGTVHTAYPHAPFVALTGTVLVKLVAVGVAMAIAAVAFIELTHGLKRLLETWIPRLSLRMFVGGSLVVLMWKAIGSSEYLGLGIPMIVRAFHDPSLPAYAFAAKIAFTAVTLASGFLGGEVTPLFFVGATLGSVLARHLGLPLELGAGVGLAAVFGAGANTPVALSVMAIELLGGTIFPHVFIVCGVAYLLTGHRGIYPSQRVFRKKHALKHLARPVALRDYHSRR